jgi:phage gp36-like protein
MAYCAIEDIRQVILDAELIQLTDDARTGLINETRVGQAIASADAEIDGYCASRYEVPFSPVPAIIKKCSIDIAVYNLHARKALKIPEARQVRYDNAVRIIKDIASGTVSLEEDTATEEKDLASVTGGRRIFTRRKLKGF